MQFNDSCYDVNKSSSLNDKCSNNYCIFFIFCFVIIWQIYNTTVFLTSVVFLINFSLRLKKHFNEADSNTEKKTNCHMNPHPVTPWWRRCHWCLQQPVLWLQQGSLHCTQVCLLTHGVCEKHYFFFLFFYVGHKNDHKKEMWSNLNKTVKHLVSRNQQFQHRWIQTKDGSMVMNAGSGLY